MKKTILSVVLFYAFTAFTIIDNTKSLPSVDLKTLQGKTINSSSFSNDGKPIIISFWATWCTPCKKELNAIAEVYGDWQKETGVKLIAISIDDSKTSPKVKPYVDSKGWEYEVYLDQNQDFKRALNVNNVPHTFILNDKKEIVWETNTYVEGGETKMLDVVKSIVSGKNEN